MAAAHNALPEDTNIKTKLELYKQHFSTIEYAQYVGEGASGQVPVAPISTTVPASSAPMVTPASPLAPPFVWIDHDPAHTVASTDTVGWRYYLLWILGGAVAGGIAGNLYVWYISRRRKEGDHIL